MMRSNTKRTIVLAAAIAATTLVTSANAAIITKANNTDNLNLTTSWVGGVVPGSGDVAFWDATVPGAATYSMGDNLSWAGVYIDATHSTGALTFNSGNTLTLGASGLTWMPNVNSTWNNTIILSAAQTWLINNGISNFQAIDTQGYQLTVTGGGSKQFKGNITGGGAISVQSGTMTFSGSPVATASAMTVQPGATVSFNSGAGIASADRVASLTLKGATATISGYNNANSADSVTGELLSYSGATTVTVTPNAARHARFQAGSFARNAGATVLLRGASMGVNSVSSLTAGAANITFGTAPSLAGDGSSGNTIGIIKGAIGDTTAAGTGYGTTGGLVTYDSANGVRLLAAGEYQAGITDGQGYESTPVYVNASIENSSGALSTTTLNSNTAVNSLSLKVTTTAGSGITITGPGSLKVASGVVYATQTIGAGATNAINIETPVDLNGQEGVILANTAGMANSTTTGRLEFKNAITNGNGLTKAGPGEVRFSGSVANTYSGTTYVNEGVLTLGKSSGVNAISGDLVINGGRVQHASSNQIPDSANITINGGTYSLQYSNSGSVFRETYNNLTMNGGNYTTGTAGHDGVSNILGTMTLNGGALGMSASDDVTVTGLATFSGGTQSISPSNITTDYNTIVSFNGGLAINNTPSSAYTPLTLQSSATNKGAKLILGGNVTFTGNATNANTVTIAAGALANLGYIDLNGAARTFNIGNGAATDDLTVNPIISNGAITKTGAGSLVLGGANTFTGPTTITAGALKLGASGSIASALVDVAAGATFDTSNVASFAMSSTQTVKFAVDGAGAGSAGLLAAAGLDITAGVVDFSTIGTLDDQAYILATYTSRTGTSFGTVNNLPANYTIDYAYMGNQIALVTIPEPGTVALAALAAGSALMLRRRSHVA